MTSSTATLPDSLASATTAKTTDQSRLGTILAAIRPVFEYSGLQCRSVIQGKTMTHTYRSTRKLSAMMIASAAISLLHNGGASWSLVPILALLGLAVGFAVQRVQR